MSNDFKSVLEVRTEVRGICVGEIGFGGKGPRRKGKGTSFTGSWEIRGLSLTCLLSRGLRTFAFLPQPQNLKQQRSRREQFSRAPVSALPLAPNHLGKSQAIWEVPG
jgi:hypothetical protein